MVPKGDAVRPATDGMRQAVFSSLAARVPTVTAIEGNGRQYCPAGNRGWSDRFPKMFHITDGTVGTASLDGPGLGY